MRLLSQFVEEIDLEDLYATYSRLRENQATSRQLLKMVLYAYMNRNFSYRNMERCCRRDINFMYLLEGAPAPNHATFARFRSLHFAPCANKYTFVWKKSVTKNQAKLLAKLADFVAECEGLYGIRLTYQNQVKMKHVKKLRKRLYAIKREEQIEFVHGIGKRKTKLQRSIETLEEYLDKLKEYTKRIHICGSRNSYSKTDHDATLYCWHWPITSTSFITKFNPNGLEHTFLNRKNPHKFKTRKMVRACLGLNSTGLIQYAFFYILSGFFMLISLKFA